MKILIAEDDATSRAILKSMLLSWGHEVVEARDGNEAWKIFSKKNSPKMAILDWIMPGISGADLCRKLRARPSVSPLYLLLLTVRVDNADVVEGLEAGADDYIRKPYNKEELKARLGVGERVLKLETAQAERIAELEKAAAHIRKLQGLLPICMYCHKIRTDKQCWQQLEQYISEHSDATFTHGICGECKNKHLAEFTGEKQ
jgi:DNA-binding response OmpR family regulator